MTRIRFPCLTLLAALALAAPAAAQPDGGHGDDDHGKDRHAGEAAPGDWPADDWSPEFRDLETQDFRVLPLHRAAGIVAERFRGRLIAARLVPPRPDERARGVVLVHRLRLLTPARDVLEIRLDARSGAFLEVAGAGLTRARRTGDRE